MRRADRTSPEAGFVDSGSVLTAAWPRGARRTARTGSRVLADAAFGLLPGQLDVVGDDLGGSIRVAGRERVNDSAMAARDPAQLADLARFVRVAGRGPGR